MKKLITILFILVGTSAFAQTPSQAFNGLLYQYNNGHYIKGSAFIPRDTVPWTGSMGDSGRIAFKGRIFYGQDGINWKSMAYQADLGYVNVQWYGAKGDGVTNNDAAFDAAIASGKAVFVPDGVFMINKRLTLQPNQTLFGIGRESVIRNTADTSAIWCDSANTVSNLAIHGDAVISPYTSNKVLQNGIRIAGTGCLIDAVYFTGLGGAAIKIDNTLTSYYGPTKISNCSGEKNNNGVDTGPLGEYVTISNSSFTLGNIGARIEAGNVSLIGGDYNSNRVGVWLVGGSGNDGHCVASGVKINHNTDYAVRADNIVEGYTFTGCMLYYGGIWLKNSQLVTFVDCDINTTGNGLKEEGATDCYFRHNKFRQFPGHQPNYNGIPSRVFFSGNEFDDSDLGIKPFNGYFSYNIIGGFWRGGIVADSTLADGGTHFMQYDDKLFNGVSGNFINYTLDTFFNISTRKFICKGYGRGQVFITGQLTVQVPTTANENRIFCIINTVNSINPSVQQAIRRPAFIYDTGGGNYQISFDLNTTLEVEPSDQIEIYVINLSGQTLTILSDNTLTFLSAMGF